MVEAMVGFALIHWLAMGAAFVAGVALGLKADETSSPADAIVINQERLAEWVRLGGM